MSLVLSDKGRVNNHSHLTYRQPNSVRPSAAHRPPQTVGIPKVKGGTPAVRKRWVLSMFHVWPAVSTQAVGVSGAERFRPNASGTIGKTCSGSGRAGAPNFKEGRQLFLRVPSSSQPLPRPYIIYIIGSPTRLVQSASTASIRSSAPPGSPNYISASPCRPPPPQCLRACPLLPFPSTRHLASGTG